MTERSNVAEDEVLVARIVGDELQVGRYEIRQRSASTIGCPGGDFEEQVRRLRPQLVLWAAPDERGRRLAKALQERDPDAEWRPGCIELSGWTDLPLSELVRMIGQPPAEERSDLPEPPIKAAAEPSEDGPGEAGMGPEAPPAEVGPGEEKQDDLGERLELVLATRAARRTAPRRAGEESGG